MAITAELPIGTLSASERTGLVRTIWDEFAAKDLFPLAVFANRRSRGACACDHISHTRRYRRRMARPIPGLNRAQRPLKNSRPNQARPHGAQHIAVPPRLHSRALTSPG